MQLVIALLAVVLGLLICFGGWRFFLLLLPFWGLLVGFNIGTEATRALFGDGTFATLTSWAVGIVLALVFAALSWFYYYAAVALLAGGVGYALGASLWGIIGNEHGVIAFVIGLAVAVVFAIGTIALNVPRYLVVILTGFGGAAVIVAGWFILAGQVPVDNITWTQVGRIIAASWFWALVWALIGAAGIIAQLRAPAIGPDDYELDRTRYRYA
jgi:hypothetical protein